jgi:hypothetical protein
VTKPGFILVVLSMIRIPIIGTLKIPTQYIMSHFMTRKVAVWCVVSGWKINGPTTF